MENISKNESLIKQIVLIEWKMFTNTKNIGSRSTCQDEKGNFFASRSAYWNMFDENVLNSYLDDLKDKESKNINIVTQKYGYMMKETDYDYFKKIEHLLPNVSEKKASLVDSIMLIYMKWEEDLLSSNIDNKNRILYKKYNTKESTSVETYMRGELLSYSEETLFKILSQFLKDLSGNKNPVKIYLNLLNNFDRKNLHTKTGFNSNLATHYSNGDLNNKSKISCSFDKTSAISSNVLNQDKRDFSKNHSLRRVFSLNLELAEMISSFALDVAKSINLNVVISILDASSNLILFKKMDDSLDCSINISQAKALTAIDFKSDTFSLSKNEDLKNLNNFSNGNLNYCFLGGGIPIKSKCGKIIGSLGISGGSVEQDCFVANKTIELFEKNI